jgi:hypothetical protein
MHFALIAGDVTLLQWSGAALIAGDIIVATKKQLVKYPAVFFD